MLVDIAIDQGGCFEDSRPTTHDDPTYRVHDSLFYCVANMPGAVPYTSTYALTNVTLPYAARAGGEGLAAGDAGRRSRLALGLNTYAGAVTEPVAEALGVESAALPRHGRCPRLTSPTPRRRSRDPGAAAASLVR